MYNTVLVVLAFSVLARCHDIAIGMNTDGRQIFNETKEASPAIWRRDDNFTVSANDDEVISRVVVTDLRQEKDGDVKIIDGGEGHKNVTLELKSPTALRGYEFHIEVYAIPDEKSGNEQEISSLNSTTDDGMSMETTSANLPSKDSPPAIVAKEENPRPVRTIMPEEKDSDVSLNIPLSVNDYTTVEPENKDSTDCTTEVPNNTVDPNAEYIKKSKDDAENHEVVDFVLEEMNDQSEKAALTADSLKMEEENDRIVREATTMAESMETTTQSDDITSTPSESDSEEDYAKVDFDSGKVPSILFKMEPPTDKEFNIDDWNKQDSQYVPVMKHLGNPKK